MWCVSGWNDEYIDYYRLRARQSRVGGGVVVVAMSFSEAIERINRQVPVVTSRMYVVTSQMAISEVPKYTVYLHSLHQLTLCISYIIPNTTPKGKDLCIS